MPLFLKYRVKYFTLVFIISTVPKKVIQSLEYCFVQSLDVVFFILSFCIFLDFHWFFFSVSFLLSLGVCFLQHLLSFHISTKSSFLV